MNGRADIPLVARRQRWLLWLVLSMIFTQGFFIAAPVFLLSSPPTFAIGFAVIGVLFLLIEIVWIIGVVMILAALNWHTGWIVLLSLLMFAPCINLFVLLFINNRASHVLRRAGLHVGLMGVDPAQLQRVLDPTLCSACGYNLTGNVTGTCSECGVPMVV